MLHAPDDLLPIHAPTGGTHVTTHIETPGAGRMASAVSGNGTGAEFWTLSRVAEALGELLTAGAPRGDRALRAVTTDTRTIQEGDCFVALRGEKFDAHDFLADAVAKGARALVVEDARRATGLGVATFEVSSTLRALGLLGRFRRRLWGKPVVAIVGSNGKTSTKELVRAALGSRLVVHATTGNLNNQVGCPLTLLSIPDDADVAVVEMGTDRPGEIANLREYGEPDLAVCTSIGEEHLEWLKDLDGVLREESEIFVGLGVAVTPAAQPEIARAARERGVRRVIVAGLDPSQGSGQAPEGLCATRWEVSPDGLGTMEVDGVTVRSPLRGAHNLRNAMLAIAVAREAGVSVEDAARGIAAMPQPSMRMAWEQVGRATLVNDAYNANPASTRAALELLAGAGAGRQRVAVLGTMRELGSGSDAMHEDVARKALASGIEVVAGVGDAARALRAVAAADPRVVTAEDPDALWPLLEPRLAPDAIVLLKASRGVRLERLVEPLKRWAGVSGIGNRESGIGTPAH
jgi:UDP-N-acetylmuramoyl-tripeptide--D-alanyl-D-alanine ligase